MRMIKVIVMLLALLVCKARAQGIRFEGQLSWPQILEKAAKENKYIFIDAYATWCVPCKRMDREVYAQNKLGELMNPRFISIKVQMDKTPQDSPFIKGWYKDAAALQEKYRVTAFPSFIFLSPKGEVVRVASGFLKLENFEILINDVIGADTELRARLELLKNGTLGKGEMENLAFKARINQQDSIATFFALNYKQKFIDSQLPQDLMTPNLAKFLGYFSPLFSFKDPLVQYIYKSSQLDSVAKRPGFSKDFAEYLISRDWIYKKIRPDNIWASTEPQWAELTKNVSRVCSVSVAERLVLDAKIRWFRQREDWQKTAENEIRKIERYGIDTTNWYKRSAINSMVYNILFKHIEDKTMLKKGIAFMETIMKSAPYDHHIGDTYAGILYKAGHKKEGIKQQEIAKQEALKVKSLKFVKEYQEQIDKMKDDKPTWL